jgi:hypothetical protein
MFHAMVGNKDVIAFAVVTEQEGSDDVGVLPARCPDHKLTPLELRELSRMYAQASRDETDASVKRALASVSYALAQLGECTERRTKVE